MNPLKSHLSKSPSLTQVELARACGLSRSYLAEILSGAKRPGRDAMEKISAGTGGAVPAAAWFEPLTKTGAA